MPLTWNVEKVENYKALDNGTTDRVIFGTLFVGVNPITEANYKEFYARYHLLELLFGAFANYADGTPAYLELSSVKARIGLGTNATNFTRPAFIKKNMERYFKEEGV